MAEPQLVGYSANGRPASNGNVSSSEVKVDKDMEMSYSPVQTDSEDSPSKQRLPPVEVIDSHSKHGGNGQPINGKAIEAKNGDVNKESDKDGEKKKEEVKMVGVMELFRFAKCFDVLLMLLGSLAACCHGAALPMMIIVFGDMIDSFVSDGAFSGMLEKILPMEGLTMEQYMANATAQGVINARYNITPPTVNLLDKMQEFAIYYIIIACVVIFVGYLQVSLWAVAAERQTKLIRMSFFRNVLRQEIGWYDTHETGELNTRLSDDINKVREGIGDKNGSFFQWFASFLAGFIIGFIYGWKLTLVILAVSPLLAIAAGIMAKLATSMTSLELKAYAKAGAVADEVLGAIRTVVAFGGQEKECKRYNQNLLEARDTGIKKSLFNGLGMGFIWLVVFGSYALGFWYGSELIQDPEEDYSPGKVLIVFFSVIIGAFSLGNAAPSLQSMATGRGAAYAVYQIIDLVPTIDSSSEQGKKPENVAGNIEFRNVKFTYPSRPDTQVLNGLDFKVAVGQTVALVGSSGCGKSTTVQLLQRFYDPSEGEVLVDGTDIRMLNVRSLRENIGVVSQEPVLFATTIAENIRYGRLDISQQQIEEVAKQANAHNFIMELPHKYETLVGERGAQLSGGQKQRVAIARALARNPKILLLDEATSALDMESEAIVQEALEKASHGRTTLVIAHRLSTVRGADLIVGIQDGRVIEQGTHDELMKIEGGVYSNLVYQQTRDVDGKDELDEFEAEIDEPMSPKRALKRMTSAGSFKRSVSVMGKEKEEEEEKLPDPAMSRVMRMNSPEWFYILAGCFAALVNGGVQPAFAILFAEILGTWGKPLDEQPPLIMMYSLILLGLGVLSCLTMFGQGYLFGKSGECLTMRIRQMGFRAMLRQEVAWFDDHKNSTGALTTRLATDASQVQGATGARIGGVVQSLANMGTAIVIAFVYGWKLTLVILAFLPVIVVAGFLQMKILTGVGGKDKEALEDAGKVAAEGIENIRTVACLTREPTFFELYVSKISTPHKGAIRNAHVYGIAFGFSQAVIFFAYAASFYFGAYLIQEGEMEYVNVFKVFSAIVFGAMGLGQASAFAPDYAKAKVSAARLFALFDRVPEIDSASDDGQKLQEGYRSAVTFEAVKFNYPTRPGVRVLNGLDISVNPGQTLALVGSSGCGKSTSVSLIERFYDPLEGQVYLDQQDIRGLNIQWLRQQIGIVSQEPVLFDCSIAENIAYGDNTRPVSMDEIITAARNANIHSFIQALPNGYDTSCGDKGTQLSGGQKQRVAIARALVRNPKILLLDEATSALDTESEKVVQEALDKAREGRTSVVIAHRLSTIQNADKICVIHHGHVVEEGVHAELMAKQGFYYRLQKIQQRK